MATIRIKGPDCNPAPVVPAQSKSGTVGVAFSYNVVATNSPTGWSYSGSLPPGLTLNFTTGLISGTPTGVGTYTPTLIATNCCGNGSGIVTITIASCPSPTVSASNRTLVLNQAAALYTISASGSPFFFNATGLPPGMSVNTSTGEITGTPTTVGTYSVTLVASNACGTGQATVTWSVIECITPMLMCDTIPGALTKTGFQENAGYESSPPKIYLTRTFSGSITQFEYSDPGCTGAFLGSIETQFTGSCQLGYYGNTLSNSLAIYTNGNYNSHVCFDPMIAPCDGNGGCPPVVTSTLIIKTGSGTCEGSYPSFLNQGTANDALSNEFTTSELINRTHLQMETAWPDLWGGECEAFTELSEDELTCTAQKLRYKFSFDATGLSGLTIEWMEGPVPKSYVWDGTATETPIYYVNAPAYENVIAVTNVVVTCT